MATYFKYAEREADSYINWAEIGKSMTDMLATETKIREDKKAAIDQASREFGEQLSTAPQGDHKGMNQWSLEYASDAQQARLMQDKLLKSGQLKLRDYVVMRQNINDGTNQAFDLMKEYQSEYTNKMERMKADQSQDFESWLMAEAEGFANFMNSKLYINPTDGTISVAKMVEGPEGVKKMSDNPNDFTTVNALRNRIKSHFDKFDVAKTVGAYVDGLGEEIQTITDIKNKYDRGTVSEYMDVTRKDITDDERKVIEKFSQAETTMLKSMMSNPYNTSSILTNSINIEKNTGKEYTFTWSEEEANKNPNLILAKNDPKSGNPMPQFSAEQEKAALSYLRTQARLMYDRKEKVSVVGASERPQQQQWQYMAEAEKKDRRSLLEQWMKIRTAVTAADKDAAAESLLSAAKNYDKGIIDVDPTSTGVVIKWADGRTLPIEYKTGDKDKSGEAWAAAGTALHGIEEQGELNRYKGAKFYNVTDAEWGNVGASYSMPPAQGEVDRVAIYNQTLGKTNDSPFGSEGTDASAPLQQMLSPLGITVTDTSRDIYGVRNNYVTIKLPNGEEIELPTKQWTPGGRQEQYRKLKSFLDENMLNDQGVLKMISGVGRRWG